MSVRRQELGYKLTVQRRHCFIEGHERIREFTVTAPLVPEFLQPKRCGGERGKLGVRDRHPRGDELNLGRLPGNRRGPCTDTCRTTDCPFKRVIKSRQSVVGEYRRVAPLHSDHDRRGRPPAVADLDEIQRKLGSA